MTFHKWRVWWDRQEMIAMRVTATSFCLFMFATTLFAQVGPTEGVDVSEVLRAIIIAIPSALGAYGAMHVRITRTEHDLKEKANREMVEKQFEFLQEALSNFKQELLGIRTDFKEELKQTRMDTRDLLLPLATALAKQQPPDVGVK